MAMIYCFLKYKSEFIAIRKAMEDKPTAYKTDTSGLFGGYSA